MEHQINFINEHLFLLTNLHYFQNVKRAAECFKIQKAAYTDNWTAEQTSIRLVLCEQSITLF